jgi:hypothetical protein
MDKKLRLLLGKIASLPTDKVLHFACSGFLVFLFTMILHKCGVSLKNGSGISCIVTFAICVAKEIWDKVDGEKFDVIDLLSDLYGLLITTLIIGLLS